MKIPGAVGLADADALFFDLERTLPRREVIRSRANQEERSHIFEAFRKRTNRLLLPVQKGLTDLRAPLNLRPQRGDLRSAVVQLFPERKPQQDLHYDPCADDADAGAAALRRLVAQRTFSNLGERTAGRIDNRHRETAEVTRFLQRFSRLDAASGARV